MRNHVDSDSLESLHYLEDKADNNENDHIYSSSYQIYENFHQNAPKIYNNYLELRRPLKKHCVRVTIGILEFVILNLIIAIILILALLVFNKDEGNAFKILEDYISIQFNRDGQFFSSLEILIHNLKKLLSMTALNSLINSIFQAASLPRITKVKTSYYIYNICLFWY